MASRLDRLWESPILRGKSSNQVIGRVYVAWGAAGCYKAFHLRSARSLSRAVQWWNFWVHLQKMIGKCHWVKSYNFDIIYYTLPKYICVWTAKKNYPQRQQTVLVVDISGVKVRLQLLKVIEYAYICYTHSHTFIHITYIYIVPDIYLEHWFWNSKTCSK